MTTRTRRLLLPVVALALVAAACNRNGTPETEDTGKPSAKPTFAAGSFMSQLQSKNKITIGVKYDIPRFGFFDPVKQKAEGFDVDLGNLVAQKLGVPAEFIEAKSANRIPFLNEDKADLIISTMTITEERRGQIDFSVVYYVARQRLLVKKDSPIDGVKSLNDRKAKVCSVTSSTSAANIQRLAPDAPLTQLGTYSECFQLLRNGQTDAVTTDDVILVSLQSTDPQNFKLTGEPFSTEPYGMGIKKGREDFLEFVNGVIRDAKADGTWKRLYDKWVKPVSKEDAEPPPDEVTV